MNWKRIILLIAIGGLVSAGCFFLQLNSDTPDVAREIFGNRQNFEAFMAASEATVQRVHYRGESNGNEGALRDLGYIHDAPLRVNSEQREELKRLLTEKSSYEWKTAKQCMPQYAMMVHFRSTNTIISVAFCFECEELLVLNSTTSPAKSLNKEDDFDPINSKLVAIAKSIFPSDPEIQAIK